MGQIQAEKAAWRVPMLLRGSVRTRKLGRPSQRRWPNPPGFSNVFRRHCLSRLL